MTHLIITSANRNIEHFLLNDWLTSLKTNVNLENIEVAALDYGMSNNTKTALLKSEVQVIDCETSGHVVNLRLRDTANFLSLNRNRYDQVLMIDGGDIIFQSDIRSLFELDTTAIRIATQNMRVNMGYIKTHSSFEPTTQVEIIKFTLGKPVLNFGVVFGPTNKIVDLCNDAYKMIVDKSRFLIDQMAINYLLHRDGYAELDKKYNFMKSFYDLKITNHEGSLYFAGGELIPVIHNNGGRDWQRPYFNFGFGVKKNQINLVSQTISTLIVKLRRRCGSKLVF